MLRAVLAGAVGLVALTGCQHVFPIDPANVAKYGRSHHDYPAADIFAPCGTTVVAPVAGTISEMSTKDVWDPKVNDGATRGGLSVTLVGDDGVRYYGSHLSAIDPALVVGRHVDVGQPLGKVGNTGDARGIQCHLHFGISAPCGVGDWQVRRGALQPAPLLDSWRAGDTGATPHPPPARRRDRAYFVPTMTGPCPASSPCRHRIGTPSRLQRPRCVRSRAA
jgi:murein DD-endopeptidase MepM/ murein hydrolase activator NlpD